MQYVVTVRLQEDDFDTVLYVFKDLYRASKYLEGLVTFYNSIKRDLRHQLRYSKEDLPYELREKGFDKYISDNQALDSSQKIQPKTIRIASNDNMTYFLHIAPVE